MKYVYILRSIAEPENHYTGLTDDVGARLKKHNAGEVPHTAKYRPWMLKTYMCFTEDQRAVEFEKYLKSGSGRAFAAKRL